MFFNKIETDRSYPSNLISAFEDGQWTLSLNPFVQRLASNLQLGTKLKGFKSSALKELTQTAMCLRSEPIALGIKVCPDGLIDFEVVGVFDIYTAPTATEAIEHLQIALCDTGLYSSLG